MIRKFALNKIPQIVELYGRKKMVGMKFDGLLCYDCV